MKQFIRLVAIQLCLCVCIVTAVELCPPGFEKVEGISKQRCFYYHMTTAGGILTNVTFADALEICKGYVVQLFIKREDRSCFFFALDVNEFRRKFQSKNGCDKYTLDTNS